MFSSATVVAHTILERYSAEADVVVHVPRGIVRIDGKQPVVSAVVPVPAPLSGIFF
jgi:hypothetical protein